MKSPTSPSGAACCARRSLAQTSTRESEPIEVTSRSIPAYARSDRESADAPEHRTRPLPCGRRLDGRTSGSGRPSGVRTPAGHRTLPTSAWGRATRHWSGGAIVKMKPAPRRSRKRAGTMRRPFSSRACSTEPEKRGRSACKLSSLGHHLAPLCTTIPLRTTTRKGEPPSPGALAARFTKTIVHRCMNC